MSKANFLKAGLVAIALAGTAVAALPARAAPLPFSFSLNLGGPGYPIYPVQPGIVLHFGSPDYFNYCLTNRQIRNLLSDNGWDHVKIVREDNNYNRVWAIAQSEDDGDWYQMRVNRCTGKVDKVHPIDYNGDGNFSFSLSF